jgi:regulator of sigma E protease
MTEVGEQAESARDAWGQIFYFAALLAVNLAVMNLLPIPALDGGRIFFLLVDAVCLLLFKKKVPEKYQGWIHTAGFAALMAFMLLVTFNDVFRLFQ